VTRCQTAQVRPFELKDTDEVVALWRDCGLTRPWNDPRADIDRKLAVQPELFLVADDGGRVVATAMGGYDGHRGWIYYVAVAPDRQGEGLGKAIVAAIEVGLAALGCPKVQLMVRPDNAGVLGFYERLGYEPFSVPLAGKRLVADS
jgi:ribosomal protein S18 acetylase RimI-like enzyme